MGEQVQRAGDSPVPGNLEGTAQSDGLEESEGVTRHEVVLGVLGQHLETIEEVSNLMAQVKTRVLQALQDQGLELIQPEAHTPPVRTTYATPEAQQPRIKHRWEYDTLDEALREARYKMEITGNVMHLKLTQGGRWSIAYDMSRRYKPFRRPLYEIIEEGVIADQCRAGAMEYAFELGEHARINEGYYSRKRIIDGEFDGELCMSTGLDPDY